VCFASLLNFNITETFHFYLSNSFQGKLVKIKKLINQSSCQMSVMLDSCSSQRSSGSREIQLDGRQKLRNRVKGRIPVRLAGCCCCCAADLQKSDSNLFYGQTVDGTMKVTWGDL